MSALPLKYKHHRSSLRGFLSGPKRDYSHLAEHDHPIKIWMPQAVWDALVELAEYHEGDLSKVIRHILFVHVYGQFDYLAQLERGLSNFSPHKCSATDTEGEPEGPENLEMMFSRPADSSNRTKELGKNNHDVKVFVPKAFSEEISGLAKQAGIPRSEYMREALIMYLFGRKSLEDRRQDQA
ncbi:MAG TPA: hypothetical protein VIC53_00105 [Wenzhouxiangella sp.]